MKIICFGCKKEQPCDCTLYNDEFYHQIIYYINIGESKRAIELFSVRHSSIDIYYIFSKIFPIACQKDDLQIVEYMLNGYLTFPVEKQKELKSAILYCKYIKISDQIRSKLTYVLSNPSSI